MKKETGGIKKVEETSNKEKINNKIEKRSEERRVGKEFKAMIIQLILIKQSHLIS